MLRGDGQLFWAGACRGGLCELGVAGPGICGKSEHVLEKEGVGLRSTGIRVTCPLSPQVAPLIPYRLVRITKAI